MRVCDIDLTSAERAKAVSEKPFNYVIEQTGLNDFQRDVSDAMYQQMRMGHSTVTIYGRLSYGGCPMSALSQVGYNVEDRIKNWLTGHGFKVSISSIETGCPISIDPRTNKKTLVEDCIFEGPVCSFSKITISWED